MVYVWKNKTINKLPSEPRPASLRLIPGVCSFGALKNIPKSQQIIFEVNMLVGLEKQNKALAWLRRHFKGETNSEVCQMDLFTNKTQ